MELRCLRCTDVLGFTAHNHTGAQIGCLCADCFSIVGHRPTPEHAICYECGSNWQRVIDTSCIPCKEVENFGLLM